MPRIVAKLRRPKKSPTVAQMMGNEASTKVNGGVNRKCCQQPESTKRGGRESAGRKWQAAKSLGLLTRSAIQPSRKCATRLIDANAPRRVAAAPSDKPFQTINGIKWTVAVL